MNPNDNNNNDDLTNNIDLNGAFFGNDEESATTLVGGVVPSQKAVNLERGDLLEKTVVSSAHSGAVAQVPVDSSEGHAKGELSTFDRTNEVSETRKEVLREQAQAKSLDTDGLKNIHSGGGINLMPEPTKEELKKEKRKTGVNLFSAFAILILVSFSLIILGLNIGMKTWLGREKQVLKNYENDLLSNQEVISANNQILSKFRLYEEVQEATFSPKEVLIYWRELVTDFGNLDSVELQNGLSFEISGSSANLRDLAFLWHLITIDEKVSRATLDSFSKSDTSSSFNFEGELNFEYFAKNDERLSTDKIPESEDLRNAPSD